VLLMLLQCLRVALLTSLVCRYEKRMGSSRVCRDGCSGDCVSAGFGQLGY
jgi:hypothetical protein